jgi:hypothetical protein
MIQPKQATEATENVEEVVGHTNRLLAENAHLRHENLRLQKALSRPLDEPLYLQDWRQKWEDARTREEADNVRIQVLRQEKVRLLKAVEAARRLRESLELIVLPPEAQTPGRGHVAYRISEVALEEFGEALDAYKESAP